MSRDNSQRWKLLRRKFLASLDDHRCSGCGRHLDINAKGTDDNGMTVDHIKSVSVFPELEFEITNLQVMCGFCNRSKHAGPGSRSRKKPTYREYDQPKYYDRTVICRYDEFMNIYVPIDGVDWSGQGWHVTFSSNGEIVDARQH